MFEASGSIEHLRILQVMVSERTASRSSNSPK
jgi:hypothetical protein